MGSARRRNLLRAVLTDGTFEKASLRGELAWVGKCLHCRSRLVVGLGGEAEPGVTVEHIRPRHHGGTDEAENLAVACARCNAQKGLRHDVKRAGDRRAAEVVERLLAERRARWRNPPEGAR